MKHELERWLTHELGEPVTVEVVGRVAAGFSRENWVVDAAWGGAAHRLIARRDPPGSVLVTDRAVEAAVLQGLEATDVPAPRLRWADLTGAHVGRPCLVMDVVDGECDGFVLAGSRPEGERLAVAHHIYDELARIHGLDPTMAGLDLVLDDPGPNAARTAVDHWEGELRREQLEPEPELTYVLGWLRDHAPDAPSGGSVLVHGDFKPGNVLLDGDRVAAVLDWETAHLGDPHEDLGWVTNPLRAAEHRVPGVWEPADLLARWEATTGRTVDPGALHWWQVLANVKLAVIVITGIRAFAEGRLDRVHQSPVGIHRLLLDQIGA